jgi:transposase InsO family protein
MESFFSSLKTERPARKVYRSRDEAKADVFDYVERFYNPKRRHSTIGYTSPHGVREAGWIGLKQVSTEPGAAQPLLSMSPS